MNSENKNLIYSILHEVFPSIDSKIQAKWGPENIQEWDSLNHLSMVMELNERFNITLSFEEVLSIETVGDIFRVLDDKGIE